MPRFLLRLKNVTSDSPLLAEDIDGLGYKSFVATVCKMSKP